MNDGGTFRGLHVPSLTIINKVIIITSVVCFILQSILSHLKILYISSFLGLSAVMVREGHIYELFTYPFMASGLIEIVFCCLILWFVGSDLENLWGGRRYFTFLLVSVIGAGFIYLFVSFLFFSSSPVFGVPLMGLGGMCNALLLAYAILFPDRIFSFMLIFPIKAKYFCMILIAMQLYLGFFSPSATLAWGHLGSMLTAFIYMVVVSSASFKNLSNQLSEKVKKSKKRNKLTLIKGDNDDNPPKYWQ